MATSKTTKAEDPTEEGGFKDISSELDQAKQDADQPAEFNDDGTVKVSEQLARRSAATTNGGGPFPPEVLEKNFIGNSTQIKTPVQEYTSHEDAGT
jgi:hypothetical protein